MAATPTDPMIFKIALGAEVKLQTSLNDIVEGSVDFIDLNARVIMLDVPIASDTKQTQQQLLSFNGLRVLSVKRPAQEPEQPNYPPIDEKAIAARETEAIAKRMAMGVHIGKGASELAQAIYDTMSKTMPCRWDATTIVVTDTIRISSPYTVDDVTGGNTASRSRIQKMLTTVLKRFQ